MPMLQKKIFVCLMFLLFISTSVTIISSSNKIANSTATITVSPTTIVGPPPDIGETFTIYINVANITDLYGWSIGLAWNPSILNCTGFTYNYTFFGPSTDVLTAPGTINNVLGVIDPPYGATLFTDYGVTGSGTLADIEFLVVGYGTTSINITFEALNSSELSIPFSVVNGTFSLPAPDEEPPIIGDPTRDPETDVTPDQAVTVSVNVTDNVEVRSVILSYSNDTGTTWYNVTMSNTVGDTYEGQIPGFPAGTNIQYKIIAYDTSNNLAVDNNAGEYYVYTVIPEFPTAIIVPMLIVLLAVTVLAKKIRPRS